MFSQIVAKWLRNSVVCASTKEVFLQTKSSLQSAKRFAGVDLKSAIEESLKVHKEAATKLRKEHDDKTIAEVKLKHVFNGLRGLPLLVYEPSMVIPNKGIAFRGTIPVTDIRDKLPKCNGAEPRPEALFWFMCTGCIPNDEQVKWVTNAWTERSQVPEYILDMLLNLPKNMHPLTKLSAAITAMNMGSCLTKAIDSGEKKGKLWEFVYEDVMNLLAKITSVTAVIYTSSFRDCALKPIVEKDKDWTENFCLNMGFDDPQFIDCMRMLLIVHSDHGGGNISAHTAHLVHSALSDPFLAYSAAANSLNGVLDGLASQEAAKYALGVMKDLGDCATEDQIKPHCEKKVKEGVIPGYGHAILEGTDPRFCVLKCYAEKTMKDDKNVKMVWMLANVLPGLLKATGVSNPNPNVHAHSWALYQHYGMKEITFYPAVFAVSRAIGVLSWLIWARGLGLPIERPKSLTIEAIAKMLDGNKSCS